MINVPSVKAAEKVGFQLQYEYPTYVVHFDREKHENLANTIGGEIIGQATEALENSEYQEAHSLFNRALAFSVHDEPGVYLLAARAAAGCNESDAAFARLASAVGLGWSMTATESGYPEFAQLQSDPRWLDLEG